MGSSAEENDGVCVSLGGEQCVYSRGAHCISIRMMRMCALECVCVCVCGRARASVCVRVCEYLRGFVAPRSAGGKDIGRVGELKEWTLPLETTECQLPRSQKYVTICGYSELFQRVSTSSNPFF